MIKLEKAKENKGFIIEEINDKLNKQLMDSGKVESGLENMATPDVASAEESNKKLRKVFDKKIADAEKKALEVKGEDRVVNPNTFKESMKAKDRKELAEFLLKLKEQRIKRRIVPLHEDAEGYKYEVKYERPLTEEESDADDALKYWTNEVNFYINNVEDLSKDERIVKASDEEIDELAKDVANEILNDDQVWSEINSAIEWYIYHSDFMQGAEYKEGLKRCKDCKEAFTGNDLEALEGYVNSLSEGDNITVTADLLNILEKSLEMAKKYGLKEESLKEDRELYNQDRPMVRVFRLVLKDGEYQSYMDATPRQFYNAGDTVLVYHSYLDADFGELPFEQALENIKKEFSGSNYEIEVDKKIIQPIKYRVWGFDEYGNRLDDEDVDESIKEEKSMSKAEKAAKYVAKRLKGQCGAFGGENPKLDGASVILYSQSEPEEYEFTEDGKVIFNDKKHSLDWLGNRSWFMYEVDIDELKKIFSINECAIKESLNRKSILDFSDEDAEAAKLFGVETEEESFKADDEFLASPKLVESVEKKAPANMWNFGDEE